MLELSVCVIRLCHYFSISDTSILLYKRSNLSTEGFVQSGDIWVKSKLRKLILFLEVGGILRIAFT